MNRHVCQGQFNGGEIEPGTFHTRNIQSDSDSAEQNGSSDHESMPDLEDENKEPDTRPGPVDVACY